MSSDGPSPPEGSRCQESELFQSARLEQLVELSPPEGSSQGLGGTSPGSTPTKGSLKRGVAVLELADVHAFLVCGFEGDDTHDYLCVWVSSGEKAPIPRKFTS